MPEMRKFFKENRVLIILYLMFLVAVGGILLNYSKEEIHLFLNEYHSLLFDDIFKNVTHLGDGLSTVVFTVLFLMFSFRKAIIIGLSGFLGGMLAQFFKRVVFSDVVRPRLHFDGVEELYFVPGVHVHTTLSLPSGHTATAFALFFVLAVFSKRSYVKIFFFFIALLVGYSRVYLSQHFLVDVYMGSFLGAVSALFVAFYFSKPQKQWLDKSLVKLFKNE